MLTIGAMPILLKIVGKLDIVPIIERLKSIDIFSETGSAKEAVKQLSREKIGILGVEIIADITPQLGKIADDLPPFVAAYKGISIDEANKLDAAEVIKEIIKDNSVVNFFKDFLRKEAERET